MKTQILIFIQIIFLLNSMDMFAQSTSSNEKDWFTSTRWRSGYYFDKEGNKIEGILKHQFGAKFGTGADNSIGFKKDSTDTRKTISINEMSAFVIEQDSFGIMNNFAINGFAKYTQDFAKVTVAGSVSLLYHFTTSGSSFSPMSTLFIVKNGTVIKVNKKNYQKMISSFFSDQPQLAKKAKTTKLNYTNLKALAIEYNELTRE